MTPGLAFWHLDGRFKTHENAVETTKLKSQDWRLKVMSFTIGLQAHFLITLSSSLYFSVGDPLYKFILSPQTLTTYNP